MAVRGGKYQTLISTKDGPSLSIESNEECFEGVEGRGVGPKIFDNDLFLPRLA